jgi:hypothetical protein
LDHGALGGCILELKLLGFVNAKINVVNMLVTEMVDMTIISTEENK